MSAIRVLQDYTFTAERETIYGQENDTAPVGLPTENLEFTLEPNKHRLNRAWGFRGFHSANSWNDTFNVVPTAQSKILITPQILHLLLPGLLQSKPDWTATADVWTMKANNYAQLPGVKTANEGYFFDLARRFQDGTGELMKGAVVNSLKLSVSPTDDEGILSGEFQFIGSAIDRNFSATGTVTHAPLTNMYRWGNLSQVSYNNNPLLSDFISCELNITNGAKFAQDLTSSEIVFPKWEVTGTIKVVANAYTEAMKNDCLLKDVNMAVPIKIVFGNSNPSAEGDLAITVNAYLTGYKPDYTEGEVIEFTFEGVFGNSVSPVEFKFFYDTTP
ncbi:MAG: hypothetical protein KatS3mg036_0500 [Ignavibacterium sp.]|uniref:phage tail tube protein n=1 Tax=Ignavibacterium sp. TaxID=2651167 RepID=UPI0021DECDE9|nr:phage tail tube protein [Ignavibacterium sp.]BDQ01946.1 MAG: hypothetical protein KatS3mg037_0521 [Ignavibacterium sp.]GIV45682.1 MAG: hypothetical protein KatS3mg036_0500 [Ignavibacterium sp.]